MSWLAKPDPKSSGSGSQPAEDAAAEDTPPPDEPVPVWDELDPVTEDTGTRAALRDQPTPLPDDAPPPATTPEQDPFSSISDYLSGNTPPSGIPRQPASPPAPDPVVPPAPAAPPASKWSTPPQVSDSPDADPITDESGPTSPAAPTGVYDEEEYDEEGPDISDEDEDDEAYAAPQRDSRAHRRRPPPPRRRRARRGRSTSAATVFLWLLAIFFLAIIGGPIAFAALYYQYAADRLYNTRLDDKRPITLVVNPGERLSHIAASLKEQGYLAAHLGVDDKYLLQFLAWQRGDSDKIKSGAYRLEAGMSLSALYDRLVKGSQDFKITVPEGKTARDIAAIVRKRYDDFDEDQFLDLVSDSDFITELGMNVPSLEGYLYPSTYFYGPGMKESDLIRMMVNQFKDVVGKRLKDAKKSRTDFTFHQHLILASLIEREARVDDDRPLIASVMFNRLDKGMRLEIDATVHFALNDWSRPLTFADLKTESPYNTYQNPGLPPGPICSPGIASIAAAFAPDESDYLFYVHKGDGHHAFAKTYEEHQANIRLYRRGRTGATNGSTADAAPARNSR